MRWIGIISSCAFFLAFALGARGSDVTTQLPGRLFASESGQWGFKLFSSSSGTGPQGILFRVSHDGKDVIQWKKQLVSYPGLVSVYAYPSLGQERVAVVTLSNAGVLPRHTQTSTPHWLVIYDSTGNVVKDYALEELLTPQELKRFKPYFNPITQLPSWAHRPTDSANRPRSPIVPGWAVVDAFRMRVITRLRSDVPLDEPLLLIDLPGDVHITLGLITGRRIPSRPDQATPQVRVSIVLHDAPLETALMMLFSYDKTLKHTIDPEVIQAHPTVTATIEDQPFDSALNSILRSAGLSAIRMRTDLGPVYKIRLRQVID